MDRGGTVERKLRFAHLPSWTPNRASLRYREDEMSDHSVRSFESGEPLDLDGLRALAV